MTRESLPRGFSLFSWGLAIFGSPVLLCPMALLLSTTFEKNSNLETWQVNLFSIFFWIYPIILSVVARILYRLHQRKPKLAFKLLVLSAVIFYVVLIMICKIGL